MFIDLDICMCSNKSCKKRKACYRAICDTEFFKDYINKEAYRHYSSSNFEGCVENEYKYFLKLK